MKIDIKEVAKKAGVSIATVSRALSGKGPVNGETRLRIMQIAEEYNYRPNVSARSLSNRKTDTIGVILPELVDEFFTEIIRGIDEEAHRSNKFIMVSSSHSERNIVETLLEFMGSGRVDGVILMAPQIHEEVLQISRKSKSPVVLINNSYATNELVSFNINNYQGAFAITEHLIEHGFKNVGIIKGPEGNCDAEERYRGFTQALEKNDLTLQESITISGDFSTRAGYYGFTRLMSQSEKPDAIFAANDMMAVGIYAAARRLKIKIPEDVAIAGFDDIFLSRLLIPRLTTVHVPIMELGSKAVRYLLKMITCKVDSKKPYFEELSTGLVIGGSCGCQSPFADTIF